MPGDLDAAIRERLDDPMDIVLNGDPYAEALRAVLELHVVTDAPGFYYESKPVRRCLECGFLPFGQRGECATKRTIAEKLGVTERTDHG
jgi:hypothetical protein